MGWGDCLAVGYQDTVQLMEARTGRVTQVLDDTTGAGFHLAWSPDGTMLAANRWDDGSVRVWRREGG